MPTSVFFDPDISDDRRRARLYAGDIFVYSPRRSVLELIELARQLIEDAFAPLDPLTAQDAMPVEAYAELLGRLKPSFIHHPRAKECIRLLLEDFGCDPHKSYFDVPRLRSSTAGGYLTSGIAYAWHPHRDTWYSAPSCQINWWTPIYELSPDNAMAFHTSYWNRPLANDSQGYNYYVWNMRHRGASVTQHIKSDPRPLPRATEKVELDPQLRLICPVGGMIMFSAAQMHSSVPNTSGVTRFSVDFRTVHETDLSTGAGAPKCDEACTGTTMRDYLRGTDLARLPDSLIARYDDGTSSAGEAVYDPSTAFETRT